MATHQRPELVSQAALDELLQDADNWRTLLHALKDRGHSLTTLEQLINHFPDFIGMAGGSIVDKPPTQPEQSPQTAPHAFLDAFLTPGGAKSYQNPLASIQHTEPVNVRDFAETETALGPVTVGYTDDGQLAFTFERTNEVYLVAITTVLSDLMAHLVTRRTISAHQKPTTRLM